MPFAARCEMVTSASTYPDPPAGGREIVATTVGAAMAIVAGRPRVSLVISLHDAVGVLRATCICRHVRVFRTWPKPSETVGAPAVTVAPDAV
ncbi:MAG: hypothetical protein E6G41_04235 [Actinobacteria bacterium]|nr:MAG: hypothetical protein E6G41_04235 [Actinomycetota bacterium]